MQERVLHPTLWRTCRALANRRRLAVLRHLARHGRSQVSEVQEALGLGSGEASACLRRLNARGVLRVRRWSRYVYYEIGADPQVPDAAPLVEALRAALGSRRDPSARIHRALTALTHPRRTALLALMGTQAWTPDALRRVSGISGPALSRHLRKLRDRGWARPHGGTWRLTRPAAPFARCLFDLARARPPGGPAGEHPPRRPPACPGTATLAGHRAPRLSSARP